MLWQSAWFDERRTGIAMREALQSLRFSRALAMTLLLIGYSLGCASSGTRPAAFPSAHPVVFDSEDDVTAFRLRPVTDSILFENRKNKVLASVREESGRLVVENSAGQVAWYVERRSGKNLRLLVRSARDESVAFTIKADSDSDIKVEDGEKKLIAVAKRRDYGFKLSSATGELIARVRSRSDKTSVRDGQGTTYLTTRDPIPPEAVVLLVFEQFPVEVAAGLGVATAFWPEAEATP